MTSGQNGTEHDETDFSHTQSDAATSRHDTRGRWTLPMQQTHILRRGRQNFNEVDCSLKAAIIDLVLAAAGSDKEANVLNDIHVQTHFTVTIDSPIRLFGADNPPLLKK